MTRQSLTSPGRIPPLIVAVAAIGPILLAGCRVEPTAPRSVGSTELEPPRTGAAAPEPLTVLAAASLASAFRELGGAYAAATEDPEPAMSFAGSQQLATQLLEGARADVFASANDAQMARVEEAGELATAPVDFAANGLVIAYPKDDPEPIAVPIDLARPGLKLVLAAPAVPVGGYALAFLARASAHPDFSPSFSETVLANVVSYEDDAAAVLGKVALGEADAGIVYASDAAGALAERVGWVAIPEPLNIVASYPIAPLARATRPEAAAAFVAFVRSGEGQAILGRHGLGPAKDAGATP